jgi:thymidylate kinase
MIIIIFGPDCSGKDSVRHQLSKLMNYEPWIIVRSPICNMVYDKLYKRKSNEVWLSITINVLSKIFTTKWIYLYATPEEILRRAQGKGELHILQLKDAKQQLALYEKYFKKYKTNNFYKFSTTNKKVPEIAQKIYDTIKE